MVWLTKLLPNHSLFGRIFLWFWLVTLLPISGAVWFVKQVINDAELRPLDADTVVRFESLAVVAEEQLKMSASISQSDRASQSQLEIPSLLDKLERFARMKAMPMMLISYDTKKPLFAMPPPMRPDTALFENVLQEITPRLIQTGSANFVGPHRISIDSQDYAFFSADPKPFAWLFSNPERFRLLFPLFAFILSGFFCALLVWHLLKPIRALQYAANSMSSGDLESRVPKDSLRHDEIGQLGHDFNRMAEQVASQINTQKRLLADISHELRSPLARQQVAVDIVRRLERNELPARLGGLLARIETENQRLNTMITELLQLSRLEGKPDIEVAELDLVRLIERLVNDGQFEASAVRKNVTLDSSMARCIVEGNAELLSRAIENVLRNAVRYAKTHVEVSLEIGVKEVAIRIVDDGNGIDNENSSELFKPFVRVSNARERYTGGVGLGLAIAAQAIYIHHGSIQASNSRKTGLRGLCVSINLPVKRQ